MRKILFNDDWLFYKDGCRENAQLVQLPHDAMIYEPRSRENTAGLGYFPGGKYIYEKTWIAPKDCAEKTYLLGYTQFYVELSAYLHAGENQLRVEAGNSEQPNSRWYSGSGLYRNVDLWIGGKACLLPGAVRIRTISHAPAVIAIETDVPEGYAVKTQIIFQGKLVAEAKGDKVEIAIPDAYLWDDEHPNLYEARVSLLDRAGNTVDESVESFGIRTIAWNSKDGLLINGQPKKLRGGCVHHDNGVLGACAFPDAEERKIRIMKKAGFNAIRSAHNPCSKALLDACDRCGVYVMDEAFDQWYIPKNSRDYALDFDAWHEKDLAAMVAKDYNHPSVILYSIGNEVIETAQERGIALAGEMRELIRGIDSTRPITCGISITQNMDEYQGKGSAKEQYMGGIEKKEEQPRQMPEGMTMEQVLAGVNMYMAKLGADNEAKAATQEAEDALHGVSEHLDIPGYNYGEEKTSYDNEHYPERVVVHSETHHTQLYEHWALIEANPHIIGDFMWVGWDHLGEAGIGALGYPSRGAVGFDKPYPYLTSGSGIIDITGFRRPESYWAQMVWHQRTEPVIAVEPVPMSGEPYMMTYWNDTEAVSAWTWPGCEGKTATVRVYTPCHEAELCLNGNSLGRKTVEKDMAVFALPYEPGELLAISFDEQGNETGRTSLTTAGKAEEIRVEAEKTALQADGQSLAFLDICITDEQGNLHACPDREIMVEVEGAGTLQGLGSGAVFTEDSFVCSHCHTFYGRALAVVRAGRQAGEIRVRISSGELCRELTLLCEEK